MARPIVWQDVAAPRGIAAAAIAADRAGQSISEALSGMGDIARTARSDIQRAATGAAVAQIANSDDPMAAAAAAGNSWEFDPLSIAQAANARTSQLQDVKVKDASLRASNLAADVSEAALEDRVAERDATDMALPFRQLALDGKKIDIDRSDARWQTRAGALALDRIDGWMRDGQDFRMKSAEHALKVEAAKAARDDRLEAKNLDALISKTITRYGTAEGIEEAPESRDRWLVEQANAGKIPLRHLPMLRQAADLGLSGNKATEAELAHVNEKTGVAGKDLLAFSQAKDAAAQQKHNQWMAENHDVLRMGQLDAKNPYKGLSDAEAASTFLKNNPQVTEGWGPNWGTEDVIQRANTIQRWAEKNKTPVTREQAFMLVGNTAGKLSFSDTDFGLIDDRIEADIRSFSELRARGGWEQVAAEQKMQEANLAASNEKRVRERRLVEAASRSGSNVEVPDKLISGYRKDPGVRAQSLTAEITMLRELVKRSDIAPAERARYTKQLEKQSAALAELK